MRSEGDQRYGEPEYQKPNTKRKRNQLDEIGDNQINKIRGLVENGEKKKKKSEKDVDKKEVENAQG